MRLLVLAGPDIQASARWDAVPPGAEPTILAEPYSAAVEIIRGQWDALLIDPGFLSPAVLSLIDGAVRHRGLKVWIFESAANPALFHQALRLGAVPLSRAMRPLGKVGGLGGALRAAPIEAILPATRPTPPRPPIANQTETGLGSRLATTRKTELPPPLNVEAGGTPGTPTVSGANAAAASPAPPANRPTITPPPLPPTPRQPQPAADNLTPSPAPPSPRIESTPTPQRSAPPQTTWTHSDANEEMNVDLDVWSHIEAVVGGQGESMVVSDEEAIRLALGYGETHGDGNGRKKHTNGKPRSADTILESLHDALPEQPLLTDAELRALLGEDN